jgi:hypothetical protein
MSRRDIDILFRRYVHRRCLWLCSGLGWEKTLFAEALMVRVCLRLIWHEVRNLIRPATKPFLDTLSRALS